MVLLAASLLTSMIETSELCGGVLVAMIIDKLFNKVSVIENTEVSIVTLKYISLL